MEMVRVVLDNDAEYDDAVGRGLPECGDLEIITKDKGTRDGNPVAVITFSVRLPDGSSARAQAVTTVNNLQMALGALDGRYGKNTRSKW